MNVTELDKKYKDRINPEIKNTLINTELKNGNKRTGKVRDQYVFDDKIILITTDRQSAFDRVLASIPFKGQVLNQTSAWWFKKTEHIIPVIIPPNMGIRGRRKGIAVPVIPIHDSPSDEKTIPKKSIIHLKAVEAKPARNPIKAANISMLWACIK